MCFYSLLESNEHGYVKRCNECQHIHVAFGTTMLALTYDQFMSFHKTISSYYDASRYSCLCDTEKVQIPTIVRSIMLVYTLQELENFFSLLNNAKKRLTDEKLRIFCAN